MAPDGIIFCGSTVWFFKVQFQSQRRNCRPANRFQRFGIVFKKHLHERNGRCHRNLDGTPAPIARIQGNLFSWTFTRRRNCRTAR